MVFAYGLLLRVNGIYRHSWMRSLVIYSIVGNEGILSVRFLVGIWPWDAPIFYGFCAGLLFGVRWLRCVDRVGGLDAFHLTCQDGECLPSVPSVPSVGLSIVVEPLRRPVFYGFWVGLLVVVTWLRYDVL
jgi:hypothetical protein